MVVVSVQSLDELKLQARPFPTHLLDGAETGLCLFSAAFFGHNDAIHFANAGVETTCVDTDAARLELMAGVYPEEWSFIADDAWAFAERHAAAGDQWDVVSVDTFMGDAEERSLRSLELWGKLARCAFVVTLSAGSMYRVPAGFRAWHYPRSERVLWGVFERC